MKRGYTGIFLEPQGTLLETVLESKGWLESVLPRQPYTTHPPHCTLLHGIYGDSTAWLETLRTSLSTKPNFAIETTEWMQFPADRLAGGLSTLALRVRPTPILRHLQLDVARILSAHVIRDEAAHPLVDQEPFRSSLQLYGSPFVGTHWIPHYTIGAVPEDCSPKLLSELMSRSPQHKFTARSVSVWDIDGNHHAWRYELALGTSRTDQNKCPVE